jgi:hypothetical protein
MFNLQTADRVASAAQLVRHGRVFPLNWRLSTDRRTGAAIRHHRLLP